MKKILGLLFVAAGSIAAYEFLKEKGVIDEVVGKTKQHFGSMTDDGLLQAEGTLQRGKGKAKGFFSDVKEGFKDAKEDIEHELKKEEIR